MDCQVVSSFVQMRGDRVLLVEVLVQDTLDLIVVRDLTARWARKGLELQVVRWCSGGQLNESAKLAFVAQLLSLADQVTLCSSHLHALPPLQE